mmetsp:Transcript_69014/g.202026  ORF Transcript_69014/g.202026 Transcript_69014/m.202026 type:complete len:213 (-) Transcript_69014:26-664(-)
MNRLYVPGALPRPVMLQSTHVPLDGPPVTSRAWTRSPALYKVAFLAFRSSLLLEPAPTSLSLALSCSFSLSFPFSVSSRRWAAPPSAAASAATAAAGLVSDSSAGQAAPSSAGASLTGSKASETPKERTGETEKGAGEAASASCLARRCRPKTHHSLACAEAEALRTRRESWTRATAPPSSARARGSCAAARRAASRRFMPATPSATSASIS